MNKEANKAKYWIALNMISNLSPKKFHLLLTHFSNLRKIWTASKKELKTLPGFERSADSFIQNREKIDPDKEMQAIEKRGLKVLTLDHSDYPGPLRGLPTPPPVLYMKGQYKKEDELALSIVGTRRCTPYGKLTAEKLAKELASMGFTIVSGMALGIDTHAHKGALMGGGRTIAVLGSGFEHIYPSSNLGLMKRIAQSGCVFSEFPITHRPAKWTFPQRNRVISGLSRGTLVVEAPQRSGSLITANLALEQGREVFAVPGNINNENTKGTHKLIKEGAKLVESAKDVVDEFPDLQDIIKDRTGEMRKESDLSPPEEQVMKALSFEPIHIDEIVEKTDLTISEVSRIILRLQMKELIREIRGKRYVKL